MFHDHGIQVLKCTSVRHAVKPRASGSTASASTGSSAPAIPRRDDVPAWVLVPVPPKEDRDTDDRLPAVFGDARGLVAALALSRRRQHGHRFMYRGSPIHQNIKQAIVDGSSTRYQAIFPACTAPPGGLRCGVAQGRRDPQERRSVRRRDGAGGRIARTQECSGWRSRRGRLDRRQRLGPDR